jgi:thiol-disulfide isomerase/thioredoxin
MKYFLFLILFFIFDIPNIKSQKLDLKHLENCFKQKYSFVKSSAIKYRNIYYTQGSRPDTSNIELRLYKNDDSPLSYHIYLLIGSTKVFYDGDSLITIYKNGRIIKRKANKANLNWLQFINQANPFYDNKAFFNDISSSRIVKQDTIQSKTFITLVNQSSKHKIVYRLNLSDTLLISYTEQDIGNELIISSSKSVYLEQSSFCEKDFEDIKVIALNNDNRTAYTSNKSKITFQIGQLFEKWHYSLNGDSINITSIDKAYYLIDLWYIGCKPCMQAIPDLIKIADEFDNIGVVGINTMNNDSDYLESYKTKNKINYSFIVNQRLGMEYQTVYPCFIVLDKNMKILYIEKGYSQKRIKKLKEFLISLKL